MKPFYFYIQLVLLVSISLGWAASSYAAEVSGIRFWQDPEKTRLVFDVSEEVSYKLFTLKSPHRLVVDIHNASLKLDVSQVEIPDSLAEKIRASQKEGKLRLVVDLKKPIETSDFLLKPTQNFGHRLVVDLTDKEIQHSVTKTADTALKDKDRDIIIAIDAGHGGEDPGALGTNKTREKNITLAVAKKLAAAINAEKGMKAILTRDKDYYVSLRKRTDIARQYKADLFVSLHADAFTDKSVRGASVWVLSPKGANSEIGRWLEQGENSSDLAGGVDISGRDPLVAQVLLDLSMHYSVGASISAAERVYDAMSRSLPKMHKKEVQKAAFVVLKMPDIPSMLVEMAFISNPNEESQLNNTGHQNGLSTAILSGIKAYFSENPPDGSYYAALYKNHQPVISHQVKKGDTLSEIANNYGVSLESLKSHNKLSSNMLKIGQVLAIPGA